jgi:hypothetical protein
MTQRPTFKPGDKVRFNAEYWDSVQMIGRDREFNRDDIYTIERVADVARGSIRAAGHHQHVNLVEDHNPSDFGSTWSGAFFELVVPRS